MILLPQVELAQADQDALSHLQAAVDAAGRYPQRVVLARQSYSNKPRPLFRRLRGRLRIMCSGNTRCVYCEDSLADEIEHMRPKDLYPEQVFVWENYVFACGPCNSSKNKRYAVLAGVRTAAPVLCDVTRKPGAPVRKPRQGRPALIDPRSEDPTEFLWLDLESSFWYLPSLGADQMGRLRAQYTVDVLGLNKRDDLVRGRRTAYSGFLSRLERYANLSSRWSALDRRAFIEDFRGERYRGVWEQMKRQRQHRAELHRLLDAVPEAMNW